MKKILFCLLLFSLSKLSLSQTTKYEEPPPPPPPGTKIKISKDYREDPSYPGSEKGWFKYLQSSNTISQVIDSAISKGIPKGKYTVWIWFIVDKKGNISELKSLTSNGYGLEEGAMQIIRESGKWIPGTNGKRKIATYRRQPITFVIGPLDNQN